MSGGWRLRGADDRLDGRSASVLLRARANQGELETWFESEAGEQLAVVSNGERAMVVYFEYVGDEGRHAIDVSAGTGTASGYRLSNGQVDSYADRDTIPLTDAADCVRATIDLGVPAPGLAWHDDRL